MTNSSSEITIIQRSIIAEMRQQLLFILAEADNLKRGESLSAEGFSRLQIIRSTILSILKHSSLIENTVNNKGLLVKRETFNLCEFLEDLANGINNMIGGHNGVNVKFSPYKEKNVSIYTASLEFEYILCSLISLIMRNFSDDGKKQVKISMGRGKDEKSFIITLSADGFPMPRLYAMLLGSEMFLPDMPDFEEMNIYVINMNLKMLSGNVEYKRTKTKNKFTIELPSEIPVNIGSAETRAREQVKKLIDKELIYIQFSEFTKDKKDS